MMNKTSIIFGLSFLMTFSAAAENKAVKEADHPPRIDISTPEKALKTYWDYLDWRDVLTAPIIDLPASAKIIREELLVGKRLEDEKKLDMDRIPKQMHRTIIKINEISDSKAEIDAKITNVTQLPDAYAEQKLLSELTGRQKIIPVLVQKKKGAEFKYTLVKDKGGWKVADVLFVSSTGGFAVEQPAYIFEEIPYSTYKLIP
jgi:hypothetical protein